MFWSPGYTAILSVATTGGSVDTVTKDIAWLSDFITDQSSVYFSENDTGDIRAVPLDGGPATTIASGLRGSFNILAQDATKVYFITQKTLQSVTKAGGQVDFLNAPDLVEDPFFPASLAADDRRVYWTEPPAQLIGVLGK